MAVGAVADAGDGPAVHRQRGRSPALPRPARARAGAEPCPPCLALRSGDARAQQAARRRSLGRGLARLAGAGDGRAWRGDRGGARANRRRARRAARPGARTTISRALRSRSKAGTAAISPRRYARTVSATRPPGAPPKARTARTSPSPTAPSRCPPRNCSTGEQKALLLGLVLAHAELVAERRGEPPILLLDEVAAHLDPRRRAALFARLEGRGQVWMTATEAALFDGIGAASRFRDRAGQSPIPSDGVDFPRFLSILHCNTRRFSKRRDRSLRDPARASTNLHPNSRGGAFTPPPTRAILRASRPFFKVFSLSFHFSRAVEAPARCARREGLFAGDADPAPGHPDRSDRPRPARHRPDRHRQDRGVHAALARPARRRAQHPEARP